MPKSLTICCVSMLLATLSPKQPTSQSPTENAPGLSAALYEIKLCTKALRCGIVYEKNRVKLFFVEDLDELICVNMRVYSGQHPRAPRSELACYADKLMKIAVKCARTSKSSMYKMMMS